MCPSRSLGAERRINLAYTHPFPSSPTALPGHGQALSAGRPNAATNPDNRRPLHLSSSTVSTGKMRAVDRERRAKRREGEQSGLLLTLGSLVSLSPPHRGAQPTFIAISSSAEPSRSPVPGGEHLSVAQHSLPPLHPLSQRPGGWMPVVDAQYPGYNPGSVASYSGCRGAGDIRPPSRNV
ncbi:unnamed protein product [Gadus morhua 'NCC']